jgi:hypothetical protein
LGFGLFGYYEAIDDDGDRKTYRPGCSSFSSGWSGGHFTEQRAFRSARKGNIGPPFLPVRRARHRTRMLTVAAAARGEFCIAIIQRGNPHRR